MTTFWAIKDVNYWEDMLRSKMKRLNVMNMSTVHKLICTFNEILIKTLIL